MNFISFSIDVSSTYGGENGPLQNCDFMVDQSVVFPLSIVDKLGNIV